MRVSGKKKFYLNLNQYRNAHHFTLAKAKINYHEIVEPLLSHLPTFNRVELTYTLFPGTEQLCDVPNICSIVDKFFSDVMVSCKKIPDDNRKFVLSVCYRYGGVDRFNPRVEVTINPIEDEKKEEEPMQIIIVQAEIEEAIEARIREQLVIQEGFRVDIELKATRGEEGYQAMIDIVPANAERKARTEEAPIQTAVTKAKGTTAAPRAPKAVTKAAIPAVAEEPPISAVAQATELAEDEAPFDNAVDVAAAPIEPAVTAEAAVESNEEETPVAPATKRPSLFGNMTAPVNS